MACPITYGGHNKAVNQFQFLALATSAVYRAYCCSSTARLAASRRRVSPQSSQSGVAVVNHERCTFVVIHDILGYALPFPFSSYCAGQYRKCDRIMVARRCHDSITFSILPSTVAAKH